MNLNLLPADEIAFLSSIPREDFESRLRSLWESGWSLSALGNSLEPARSKTTIHFWVRRAATKQQFRTLPPPPPKSLTSSTPTRTAPRTRSISPSVPPDMRGDLKDLSTLARKYRARTPHDSPIAVANSELTSKAKFLRSIGVPTAAIAEAAGVSYRAMARRLSEQ